MRKLIATATIAAALLAPAAAQAHVSIGTAHRQANQLGRDKQIAVGVFDRFTVKVAAAKGYAGGCQRLGRNAVLCQISFIGRVDDPVGQLASVVTRTAQVLVYRPTRHTLEADLIQ